MMVINNMHDVKNIFNPVNRSEKLWLLAYIFLMLVPFGMIFGKAPIDIAISGVALTFIIHSYLENSWHWLTVRWVKVAIVLWIYYMLIAFQAIQVWVSFEGALTFIRFILFGIACQFWLLNRHRIRGHMVTAIELATFILLIAAWYQYFVGVDFFGNKIVRGYRLTALSGKQVVGGYLVMMSWPVIIKWFNYVNNKGSSLIKKMFYVVAIVSWIVLIPITGERTSTLWLLLGLALMFLFLPQLRKSFMIIIGSALLILSTIIIYTPNLYNRMFVSIPKIVYNAAHSTLDTNYQTNNVYSDINQGAIIMFKDKPWFGTGLKQHWIACTSKKDTKNCTTTPQNMYLELITNTGILGTIIFAILMIIWIQYTWVRRARLSKTDSSYNDFGIYTTTIINDPIHLGVLIAFLIRIFPFVTTSSLYFSWSGITFWWMSAWLMAAINDHKSVECNKGK